MPQGQQNYQNNGCHCTTLANDTPARQHIPVSLICRAERRTRVTRLETHVHVRCRTRSGCRWSCTVRGHSCGRARRLFIQQATCRLQISGMTNIQRQALSSVNICQHKSRGGCATLIHSVRRTIEVTEPNKTRDYSFQKSNFVSNALNI